MTPAQTRRLGKAVALLGSPHDGEVIAAAHAIGRTLDAAGMDWNGLAALVSGEVSRRSASGFTFATAGPRHARKLMAHVKRRPTTSAADSERLEGLRARLLGARKLALSREEIEWLDALWRAAGG